MRLSRRLVLTSLTAAACRPRTETVLLTFPESYGHHLSQSLGHYATPVRAVYLQSYAKMMEALLAGDGHVATAAYDAVLPLAAEGRDPVAFCSLALRPGIVLAAGDGITRIADLRGRTIGIPGPGSSSHFLLNAILRRHGVDPNDAPTVGIGVAASAVAAVEQRKVDAAMLTNLGFSTLRRRGANLHILADPRDAAQSRHYFAVERLPSLCLVGRRQWLDSNPAAARAIVRAFLQSNRWMAAHQAAEIRAALPEQAQAADAEADIAAIEAMRPTLDTDGRIELASAQAAFAITAASVARLQPAKLDLMSTFTNAFLAERL
ncbi:MAG: ABC transporter substrate-binding protein [Bryobacterales bacterium]|nr:ABC transporter substrate-binding protein [Bryobacterales bacterium]